MSIEVIGVVTELRMRAINHVVVVMRLEMSRSDKRSTSHQTDPDVLEIIASKAEAEMYRPGTEVRLMITPTGR